MKAMVCEMCSSHDLVKQDGMFVCQHCGTKYSVEEAKKLMIEGTVKVDTTDRSANLYKVARQAKAEGNITQAGQYYNELAVLCPEDWEASFYSAYYQALNCNVLQVMQATSTITNRTISTLDLLHSSSSSEKVKSYVEEIVNAISNAFDSLHASARKCVAAASPHEIDTALSWDSATIDLLLKVGRVVEEKFQYNDLALTLYKKAAQKCQAKRQSEIWEMINRLAPENQTEEASKAHGKGGGCYVATAVYGSYDCPEVWTLRRFRDNTLAETWYGRVFIRVYYAISPTLVKWFGKTEWFKNLWKPTLDRMVEKLNESGVEDTPYVDRAW